jgi:hypothetical protein
MRDDAGIDLADGTSPETREKCGIGLADSALTALQLAGPGQAKSALRRRGRAARLPRKAWVVGGRCFPFSESKGEGLRCPAAAPVDLPTAQAACQ